jgi:large subunit ribosomal protein L4
VSPATTAPRPPVAKARPAPAARTAPRFDVAGTELGRVDLEPSLFGIEPNEAVLHQVVTAQLAAARSGTQATRTRAEVRGGGAKPYRQKGTGRARQGSTRAPHYSGGGVALGPKPRSYKQRTPKKMVRLALASALSDRAADGRIVIVDRWSWEKPKTKQAVAALDALDLGGRVLLVLSGDDVVADRAFSNLGEVDAVLAGELCAYDVLRSDWVVFTDATLPGAEAAGAAVDGDAAEADDGASEVAGPADAGSEETGVAEVPAVTGETEEDGDA